MAINALINLKVILLVLFALCALFLTNTQATSSSLSDLYGECERKFWFKDLKDFKKSIKSKCMKEDNHYKEKRNRQHHVCNNKHHDKKLLRSKWEKFADCRCESALVKLSDLKESKIFVCYQIAAFNKATGEFLGKLTAFKKESESNYDVAIRFSEKVKLDGQWNKYNKQDDVFFRVKKDKHPSRKGDFLVEKTFILGRIPKHDSMNKISVDKISPTDFILILKNGRVRSLKENKESVIIPFSKFVPSIIFAEHKEDKNKNRKKKPSNKPDSPPENPAEPSQDGNEPNGPQDGNEPNGPQDGNVPQDGTNPQDGTDDGYGTGGTGPQDGTGGGYGQDDYGTGGNGTSPTDDGYGTGGTGPQDGTGDGTGEPQDSTGGTEPQVGTGPQDGAASQNVTGPQDTTNPTSPTNPTNPTGAASAGQEAGGNAKSDASISSAAIGSIIFGGIIAIGAAFIGYNTYERIRWRRQYRRREAAAQQNTSLANVPDYNGYGRAY